MKRGIVKRLIGGVLISLLSLCCLSVTTLALTEGFRSVENNRFSTGTVKIDLNGGASVIGEEPLSFTPGTSVERSFYLENKGDCEVYYRLYFTNVSGDLAEYVTVTVKHGEKLLYRGYVSEMDRAHASAADDTLMVGEKRSLTISLSLPEETGSEAQNSRLTFSLSAEATQVKNNPDREFN